MINPVFGFFVKKFRFAHIFRIFFLLLVLVVLAVSWSCKNDAGTHVPNYSPIVRLSNVPPTSDTVVSKTPRDSLYWVGDDGDGFVVGYRYRWTINNLSGDNSFKPYIYLINIIIQTKALIADVQDPSVIPAVYHYFSTLDRLQLDPSSYATLNRGDSIIVAGVKVHASNADSVRDPATGKRVPNTNPVHLNPTKGNFIFESPDSINLHTFEVQAIDDQGAVSDIPARISFYTIGGAALDPIPIISSGPADTVFVLRNRTASFPGIPFGFSSVDPNSPYREYSWVVDKDQWPPDAIPWSAYSPTPSAFAAGSDMPDPYALTHTMYLRVRNEFGAVSPVPATRNFQTLYPEFAKEGYAQRILLINSSFDSTSTTPWNPTRQMITDYYLGILSDLKPGTPVDTWSVFKDPPNGSGFPRPSVLSNYSLVIFTADHGNYNGLIGPSPPVWNKLSIPKEKWLASYCYVGGKLILSGWALRSVNNMTYLADFYSGVLHVDQRTLTIVASTFAGAKGYVGYPDIQWDSTKLDTAWHGALPQHWLTFAKGFGEYIYTYISTHSRDAADGQQMGVRYLGVTFDCIIFPFPLYYAQRPLAEAALQKALSDIGELNRP